MNLGKLSEKRKKQKCINFEETKWGFSKTVDAPTASSSYKLSVFTQTSLFLSDLLLSLGSAYSFLFLLL